MISSFEIFAAELVAGWIAMAFLLQDVANVDSMGFEPEFVGFVMVVVADFELAIVAFDAFAVVVVGTGVFAETESFVSGAVAAY